ncbi:MAG: hypothetical protein JWQ02_4456 [Capsulimonas sp.]|nr:hypothetical protein [Capsulimonas sp.]
MRLNAHYSLLALALLAAAPLTPAAHADDTWQYSIRVGQDPLRRAYLWVPPKAQHLRGVILGVQNMLEQPMFEDDVIRKEATEDNLAIVWLSPRDDFDDKNQSVRTLSPAKPMSQAILQILAALSKESGYTELANAPMIVTAHSASTPFVYNLAATLPSRMVAVFPYKGWIEKMTPGIPTLHITSEYAEVGGDKWGEVWRKDIASTLKQRAAGDDVIAGEFAEIGNGHYEWNPEVAPILAMFIHKAIQYRLPAGASGNGVITLKPIDPKSGWLIDPDKFGTPDGKPVPYAQWVGDPTKALWYFDEEMARTINDYAASRLAKKPQVIDFVENGQPISLATTGGADLHPQFLANGATFKVTATSLDQAPVQIYGGAPVGHAPGPIQFKVSSGALKQTGPDTFQIWMRRGGLIQQGSPWEPWIMAYQNGNAEYRRADRPGHAWLNTINRDGAMQIIDFARIGDQKAGAKSIHLNATSDAGLPVQLYVISGPVRLRDDNRTLEFLPIPPRSKFPVHVVLGAYQWGRTVEPKVQTAGPVTQEFWISR